MWLVDSKPSGEPRYKSTLPETQSGWSEQIIRSGINIDYQISLLINSSGEHNIVYRNSGAQNIEFSSYNGGWITEILGVPGGAISPAFDS